MPSRLALTASLLAACLLSATLALAQPVVGADGRGRVVRLAAPPKRIVSTAPAVTEMLFALGVGGRVVGATAFCDYPPAAKRIPRVGDSSISVEKIVALRPDIVFASGSANSKAIATLERMPSFRAPVFVIDPTSLSGVYSALVAVGRVVGRQQQAVALATAMRARADRVAAATGAAREHPSVLIVVQPEPLWVADRGTFMAELVAKAGGQNLASGTGFHTMTVEKALAARPDVILVGSEGLAKLRANALWHATPAYRSGRIYPIDPSVAARPGPRLVDALEQIARLLHPGLKLGGK